MPIQSNSIRHDESPPTRRPCSSVSRPRKATGAISRARNGVALLLVGLCWLGCASAPLGPAFEWAPEPPPNRGRLYVFRSDPRASLSTVRVRVNGLEVGRFRDREYQTLELPAGSHRLRAGMRGFAFANWGWNEHVFRVRPGETVFIEISVRLDAGSSAGVAPPREAQIGGRAEGHTTENVFILHSSRAQASASLTTMTRLPPEG